jgi:hypothetical protein
LTVEVCEMLRVRGEPKPKPNKAAGGATIVTLTRLEALWEMLKADNERLKSELAAVKVEFQDARDDARRERDRLLDLLAAQQRVVEGRVGRSMLIPQPGEMTEAEAVLAAQQRVESQNHQRD